MSAYKDALHVTASETGPRALLASEILSTLGGVVVLDSMLALRPEPDRILCEVIAQPGSPANYQAAVQAAQSHLKDSTLFSAVSGKVLSWLVVDDYGTGVGVLWHGS
jgi:hypothetical protein